MATFQKLTRANVKALKPGHKISEQGITFERLGNGDGVYSINIMVDRQRIHRVIGRESDGTTRTQAEIFIETTRTAAREDRLALPKGRKVALSFADAGARYITKLRESGGRCIDRKERQLAIHLNPFFGSSPLNKVSSFDIARYRKHRIAAGAAEATINRELAVVSHLYGKANEWGWTMHRPKIERFKEDKGRIVYLTPEQCQRVIEEARHDLSPHIYPFTVIALSTSMRMSEILSMTREHVDVQRKRIFIPDAKAGARDQPITTELATFLAAHIEALPKGSEWLFPSIASKSGRLATIRKAHRRVVKAAGLDPDVVVRHTFRHTAITHLVQAGVDLPTVQKISGHKTLAMVGRYAHANGAHIDAAMDKLEGRIGLGIGEIAA
ncbi:site-specific integrase [Sphingomonas sp. LB-2]|uniref:tyrosine-type recombinase/integrase n=1 Tax=Sphingomonas caeni TaxID=2984949 RepID=UPI0022308CFA|nr:site-specific integrase [Sphingomonas caeni]MCW3848120.1 site-specific integrase [Sphingomonas caeni]